VIYQKQSGNTVTVHSIHCEKKILGALSTTVLLIQMDMILLVSLSTNHGIQSLLFHVITCEFVKFKTIISQIYLQSRTRLLTRTER